MEESSVIQELVSDGIGIAFTPLLQTKFNNIDTISIPINDTDFKRSIGISYIETHFQSEVQKNFMKFVQDFFTNYDD